MLRYKIDIADALERIGFNLYQAKKTGIISQVALNKIKNNDTSITLKTLNNICMLLDMQPKDLLIYEEVEKDKKNIELFKVSKK